MRVISQPQSPAPQQGQRRSPSPAPLPLPPGGLNVKLQSVAARTANGVLPEQQENGTESLLRAQDRRVVADTVAQAAWAEKKWVWVEHAAEGYVAAHVVEESGADGEQLTVEFTDGKVRSKKLPIEKPRTDFWGPTPIARHAGRQPDGEDEPAQVRQD